MYKGQEAYLLPRNCQNMEPLPEMTSSSSHKDPKSQCDPVENKSCFVLLILKNDFQRVSIWYCYKHSTRLTQALSSGIQRESKVTGRQRSTHTIVPHCSEQPRAILSWVCQMLLIALEILVLLYKRQ